MKTHHFFSILFCFLFAEAAFGGNDKPEYSFLTIPNELTLEAHTVIRENRSTFIIKDLNLTVERGKIVRTILNRKGDHNAGHYVFYDKERSIKSFSGSLYDKSGNFIRKLKNSEIKDYSAISSVSIFDDNRVKAAELLYSEYPFTVEFEYEVEYKGSYYIPSWAAVEKHSESVMHTSFQVSAPKDYDLRYREYNYPGKAVITSNQESTDYYWEIKNFKAFEPESYMPEYKEIIPWVDVAPSDFILSGYSGSSTSWKSLGEFFWNLNKGRDVLPSNLESEIKALTAGASSDREKVKILYNYLQKTTRYVSIQLGIGGFQPFEAKYVKENGYGDCKALSNYMYSMLKAVGIPSFYTLVRAGVNEPDFNPDFPSDPFNHVILCVPNAGDTIWLECTSQTVPFGYLSRFTMDRHVLLITENGGVLTKTPSFDQEKNLQLRKASVQLFDNGSASSVVNTKYMGYQYENVEEALGQGEENQKKFLYENISIPSFEISNFKFSCEKDANPKAYEELTLEMRRFATLSGKRIFFQPNLMNQAKKLDKPQKERKFGMVLHYPYTDVDTMEYQIPAGFHLEFIPEPFTINSEFGSYSAQITQEEGKIIYIRKRVGHKGAFEAAKYREFVDYVNKIADADKLKLVLVSET